MAQAGSWAHRNTKVLETEIRAVDLRTRFIEYDDGRGSVRRLHVPVTVYEDLSAIPIGAFAMIEFGLDAETPQLIRITVPSLDKE